MFTQLNDRILWFDGDISVDPEVLIKYLVSTHAQRLFVSYITPDVEQFNKLSSVKLTVKTQCAPMSHEWHIPEQFKTINVFSYVWNQFKQLAIEEDLTDDEINVRIDRLNEEIEKYKESNVQNVICALIYVVNILTQNNIIWGIGRGSSVSSYLLYVIGLHDVDSVKYGLPLSDFFKE